MKIKMTEENKLNKMKENELLKREKEKGKLINDLVRENEGLKSDKEVFKQLYNEIKYKVANEKSNNSEFIDYDNLTDNEDEEHSDDEVVEVKTTYTKPLLRSFMQCSKCNFKTQNNEDLKKHVASIHKTVKFKCD